ncbi:MAG: glutathione S-transferase family protein [Betaproteobacteria bacterium]
MLVIWGNADSINVQKVLWCCEEMRAPYQRIDAGRHFGVVDTPEFQQLNPNGLVPTIDDDGFVVWESNTIVRYLAAKHAPGTLWPSDPRARADADRWMDWANSTLWPTMVPLFRALMRTPASKRDPVAIETVRQESFAELTILDAHLATTEYVGGTTLTMGDIAVGCGVWRWMALPIERPPLPHLQRWFDMLAARAAYRKVVMLPLT